MRRLAPCLALALSAMPGVAHAQDEPTQMAPPLAPFRRGLAVEGSIGVYAPTGRLKNLSSPGQWLRAAIGWDFTKWFGIYAFGDAAFLSTDRAPPPPGDRAYVVWGFGGGARASVGIGERVRVPLRVELGMHRASDDGVLGAYGYDSARDLGFSYGALLGVEWRAASRHFGLVLEGGARVDTALAYTGKAETPAAIVADLAIHYTL